MEQDEKRFQLSDEQKNQLYQAAINTCLEMDMAFKLYSFGITTADSFIDRILDLSDFMYVLEKRIKNDSTGEMDASQEARGNKEPEKP